MTQSQDPSDLNENSLSPGNVNVTPGNEAPPPFMTAQDSGTSTTVQPSQASAESEVSPEAVPAHQAFEAGKATVSDAVTVLKQLHEDPNQGILGALDSLGEGRAFNVGLALCLLFPIMAWSAIVRGIDVFLSFLSGFNALRLFAFDLVDHLKGVIATGVPVIALILGLMAMRALFKTRGTVKQFTFIAGICLLPLSANFFLLWLLGVKGLELSGLFGIFSCSIFVLLLNSSLISIMGLSTKKALWLVPTLLVAVVFFTQVVLQILF